MDIEEHWVQRNRGTLGTEEQWVKMNSGYRGTVGILVKSPLSPPCTNLVACAVRQV